MNGTGRDSHRPRRRLPLGLLGMLAMVVAAEAFVKHHERVGFTTPFAASWKRSARAAGREAVQCPLLCFGDSMLKFGLVPQILRDRTGLPVYNLAPWGGPPAASYILLRRALDAGARPRAIVFDCNLHLLMQSTQFFIRSWQELATLAEALDLAWTTRDPAFFAQIMLGRVLPSVRVRYEIRESTLTALKGGSTDNTDALRALSRNWRLNCGSQLHPAAPQHDGLAKPEDVMFATNRACDPSSIAYLRRFLDLAAEHHIRVFWILPPLAPPTQQKREQIGIEARFTRLVKTVQALYPGVVVIDARHAGFTDAVFLDHCHLDRHGAAALSRAVSAIVKAHLGREDSGARWVLIPPSAGAPIEAPGEDLIQSLIAVRSRDARPRR